MALTFCGIIWCLWQINKWLCGIGRLILATDNWSTHTNLSHCHSNTINTRLTWEWAQAFGLIWCCLTACLYLLFCVLINLMPLRKNHKSCLSSHKLIIKGQLSYRWINCSLSIPWECIRTIMHYTTIVIRHSEIGDYSCWVFKKIVFHPW